MVPAAPQQLAGVSNGLAGLGGGRVAHQPSAAGIPQARRGRVVSETRDRTVIRPGKRYYRS